MGESQSAQLPLAGVRVLDVSTVLAAPLTSTFLGDFGAEVVKIEDPQRGDFTRGRSDGGRSPFWAQEARNKRSVTIDLRTTEGQDLLHQLVPHFDVVVTNYRPPTLAEWRMLPEHLESLNPSAVLVYITGYGLTGPYSDRGAFDRIASAFAGLTYVSGYPDRPPVRSGVAVIDYMSAYLAAFATVTALYHRDNHPSGQGQVIDLALYEPGFRASEDSLTTYATTGAIRERIGNRKGDIVPASDFATADGRVVSVHAGTDSLFRKLVAVMGDARLDDPTLATRDGRADQAELVYQVLAEWVGAHNADDVARKLNDAGIPASPMMNIADIAADPHYRERGTIVEVNDPDFGVLPMAGPMPRMSKTPGSIRSTGPALGEGTDELLKTLLDLTPARLADLRSAGVI